MEKVNSYIFFPRSDSNHKRDRTVFGKLSSAFEVYDDDISVGLITSNYDQIEKEIMEASSTVRKGKILLVINDVEIKAEFKILIASSTQYLDITVTDDNEEKAIETMEYIHDKIVDEKSEFNNDFIIIVSDDSISEYYCNKIYPSLGKFERKLRKLLFVMFTAEFKEAFFDITISDQIKENANRINKARNNEEIKMKKSMYALSLKEIQDVLFEKLWTKYEDMQLEEVLNQNDDLGKLGDKKIREIVNSIRPKSNWERIFLNKEFDENFEQDIDTIRNLRNLVAHNRLFNKEEYLQLKQLLDKRIVNIENAIMITETDDFQKINERNVHETMTYIESIAKAIFQQEFVSQLAEKYMQSISSGSELLKNMMTDCDSTTTLSDSISKYSTEILEQQAKSIQSSDTLSDQIGKKE